MKVIFAKHDSKAYAFCATQKVFCPIINDVYCETNSEPSPSQCKCGAMAPSLYVWPGLMAWMYTFYCGICGNRTVRHRHVEGAQKEWEEKYSINAPVAGVNQ